MRVGDGDGVSVGLEDVEGLGVAVGDGVRVGDGDGVSVGLED